MLNPAEDAILKTRVDWVVIVFWKPQNMEMSCVPALWGMCCPTICRCTSCPNCIQPCQTLLPSAMLSSHYECGQSLGYPCPMCDWITDATRLITCVLENSTQLNCSSTMLSLWHTLGMLRKISPLRLLTGRYFYPKCIAKNAFTMCVPWKPNVMLQSSSYRTYLFLQGHTVNYISFCL